MNEFLFNNPEIVTVTHYLDVDQVTGFSESRPAYSHPTIPIELITLTHKEAIHPEGLLILVPPFMQTISDIVNHDFQSQLIANFVSQNWRVAVYQDAGILGVKDTYVKAYSMKQHVQTLASVLSDQASNKAHTRVALFGLSLGANTIINIGNSHPELGSKIRSVLVNPLSNIIQLQDYLKRKKFTRMADVVSDVVIYHYYSRAKNRSLFIPADFFLQSEIDGLDDAHTSLQQFENSALLIKTTDDTMVPPIMINNRNIIQLTLDSGGHDLSVSEDELHAISEQIFDFVGH